MILTTITSDPISQFIDPLTDFGFKHLLGSEPNKEIMIAFLNAIFAGKKEIVDLVFSPTEYAGNTDEYKKVFFDLMCTGRDGDQFIIEMQRREQECFHDRCIFFLSRLISEQLPKGTPNWDTRLKEVYLIAILEFKLKDNDDDRYLHDIALMNKDTGEVFYDKRKIYESNLKAKRDYMATIEFAKKEEGDKARIEGREEGDQKARLAIALELRETGMLVDQISKITKLSIEEIEKL